MPKAKTRITQTTTVKIFLVRSARALLVRAALTLLGGLHAGSLLLTRQLVPRLALLLFGLCHLVSRHFPEGGPQSEPPISHVPL